MVDLQSRVSHVQLPTTPVSFDKCSRARAFPLSLLALLFVVLAGQTHAAPSPPPPTFLNISIPVTSPKIVYTPFLCTAAEVVANPQLCASAWQAAPSRTTASTPFVSVVVDGSTSGSTAQFIPQLFFEFQASTLYLQTLPPSNATATITIVSNGTTVAAHFDSSLGSAAILNLPEDVSSLFSITLLQGTAPTVFILQSITLTALADISLSSLFPSATLPFSLPPTAFSTPTTAAASTSSSAAAADSTAHSDTKKKIAEGVGITLGLGLGLTALGVLVFWLWRRRRRAAPAPASTTGPGNGIGIGNTQAGRRASAQRDVDMRQSEWRGETPRRHRPRWPV